MFELENIAQLAAVSDALRNHLELFEDKQSLECDLYDDGVLIDLITEIDLVISRQGY